MKSSPFFQKAFHISNTDNPILFQNIGIQKKIVMIVNKHSVVIMEICNAEELLGALDKGTLMLHRLGNDFQLYMSKVITREMLQNKIKMVLANI